MNIRKRTGVGRRQFIKASAATTLAGAPHSAFHPDDARFKTGGNVANRAKLSA